MSLKSTPVTANSVQLTRLGLINCYLVRETDGFTLIDTGISGAAKDLIAAADAAGAPIRRILLTHAHGDHVGSLDALAAKFQPGSPDNSVQLAASPRSLPLLRQPPVKSLEPGEPAGPIRGSLPGIRTQVTHQLSEGDLIGSLSVLETPGHLPGHLCFLDERDGTLYAGDALISVGKLAVSGYAPWYFSFPNFATWNKATALASAQKLLSYSIQRFACGHGPVRGGGIALLRQAIAAVRS